MERGSPGLGGIPCRNIFRPTMELREQSLSGQSLRGGESNQISPEHKSGVRL